MPLLPILFNLMGKISPLLSMFKKHWKVLLVLLTLTTLGFYIYNLNSQIAKWQEKHAIVSAEFAANKAVCALSISQLEAGIEVQNKKIDKLGRDLKRKEQLIAEAAAAGKQIRKDFQNRILQILNSVTPTSCEESIQFLIDGKEDLKW